MFLGNCVLDNCSCIVLLPALTSTDGGNAKGLFGTILAMAVCVPYYRPPQEYFLALFKQQCSGRIHGHNAFSALPTLTSMDGGNAIG